MRGNFSVRTKPGNTVLYNTVRVISCPVRAISFKISAVVVANVDGCVVRVRKTAQHLLRSDGFTAVTMKNVVFWDIITQFVPHSRHYVSGTEPSQLMLCKI
jgi:hypothetical protein